MKHKLELQVRESPQVGFTIPIGHHLGTRLAIPQRTRPHLLQSTRPRGLGSNPVLQEHLSGKRESVCHASAYNDNSVLIVR